jgi:hypothetical protein
MKNTLSQSFYFSCYKNILKLLVSVDVLNQQLAGQERLTSIPKDVHIMT